MIKSISTLLLLILTCSLNSLSQDAIFRGFVHEKSSGEVIPFQKVKIYSASNEYFGALTDVNGFFSIPKLSIGKYAVSIENSLYQTILDTIEITSSTPILQKKYELEKESKVKELGVDFLIKLIVESIKNGVSLS